ncbi:TonB-dependent receptor domain-containing protein [Lysobacter firmicutimachus]|uniref:TonB-dependent receptor n=1 Tax=Lysobacter firmicutimachus TaxID=1792846 RepID=A0ABU8D5D0_9GAMM
MFMQTNPLRDAIVVALASGVSVFSCVGYAAEQGGNSGVEAEKAPVTVNRVEVTGTRLRQVDMETAQPVTVIDRQSIEKQGFQSVSDILQAVSATGAPPASRASPLLSGEAVGGSYVSLRNLGAARTLVLLNGRRLGVTTGGLADISSIPAAMVERIEVLKDGASSIYGSDAISGVINIITRADFNGASIGGYIGQYSQGDGGITNANFSYGHTGERFSIAVGGEIRDEDRVAASDREFSAYPRSNLHPTDGWSTVSAGGGFVTSATNRIPGIPNGTRVVLRDGGNPRTPADYIRQDVNTGSCAVSAGASINGCVPGSSRHKSNPNAQTDLRTPLKSKSLFVDGRYRFSDSLSWRTNLLYGERDNARSTAGMPMQAASFAPTVPGMSAQSYFNPTSAPIRSWWRRTWEMPRITEGNLKTLRVSSALEGSFQWRDRYVDWDVGVLYNDNKSRHVGYGNLNTPNTQMAVGPSFLNAQGRVQCGTAAAPIPFSDCVPFNPFLGYGVIGEGGLTGNPELQAFLSQPETARGETKTKVVSANVSTTVFDLPAGPVGLAAGIERRVESGTFTPSAAAIAGTTTALAAGPTGGRYSVNEFYAETEIPILADKPFAKELTLNIATRFSDYDTFGQTTNNKFGLKWRPVASLLLRATVNDGFRAPTIADLYGGGSDTFSAFTDPCDTSFGSSSSNPTTRANCVRDMGAKANTFRQLAQGLVPAGAPNAQTPVAFRSESNPGLTPEVSKSQTIGAVWSPDFIDGLNIAVDWWKMRISQTIVADSPTNMLADCYVLGIQSRCEASAGSSFTRDPALGYVNSLKFSSINAGFRKVEGFDVDVTYRKKTGYGDFVVTSNSTYTSRDYFVSTDNPRIPISDVGVTSTFRVRSNLNIGWDWGHFGISWSARYYSSMKEGCTYFIAGVSDPHLECSEIRLAPTGSLPGQGTVTQIQRRNRHGSTTFNDVQFRWNTPWDASVALGVNNVFKRYGPVMYTQPSSNVSYYGGFDVGRFVYLKYTQRF